MGWRGRWALKGLAVAAVLVSVVACGQNRPTGAEIAAAIQGCGIPPGGASLTFGKDRAFLVRGRYDLTYKQFTCVMNWAQSKGFKSKIALIGAG
jgi:hypothetical protein